MNICGSDSGFKTYPLKISLIPKPLSLQQNERAAKLLESLEKLLKRTLKRLSPVRSQHGQDNQ